MRWTDWTFSEQAYESSLSGGLSDDWSAVLLCVTLVGGPPPVWIPSNARKVYATTPGATYLVIVRVKPFDATVSTIAKLQIKNPSTAALADLVTLDHADAISGWQEMTAIFTATGASVEIWLANGYDADSDPLSTNAWLFDDLEFIEMAKTAQIKAALVDDLEQISTANGYTFTVAEVGTEPKRVDEARFPGLYLIPGAGGSANIEELGNRAGYATQRYGVQLFVRSTTPNTDMDNLLDDVRNAVERSAGNLMGISGVEYAGVSQWSEVVTEGDINEHVYYRELVVEIRYEFTRGAA